jgi:hypothetical protein
MPVFDKRVVGRTKFPAGDLQWRRGYSWRLLLIAAILLVPSCSVSVGHPSVSASIPPKSTELKIDHISRVEGSVRGSISVDGCVNLLNASVHRGETSTPVLVSYKAHWNGGSIELLDYAPLQGVVVARVAKSVERVSWASDPPSDLYDEMVPISGLVILLGPPVPFSTAKQIHGELLAMRSGRADLRQSVSSGNVQPPPLSGSSEECDR